MPKWRLESTRETREKIERLREDNELDEDLDWIKGLETDDGRRLFEITDDSLIDSNLERYRNGNTMEEGPYGFEGMLNDEENSQSNSELLERFYIIRDKYNEELNKYELALGILRENGKEIQESDFDETYDFFEFEFEPSNEKLNNLEERLNRLIVERENLEEQVRELEEQARRKAEEQARREAEERARREAEEQARREAEERVKREAEERARREAEEQAKREADERARREAEEQEKRASEERARQAEEQERIRQEELKIFMEEIAQKAEQERIKREERLKNPYGAIAEDIQVLRGIQNEDGKKEIQENICRTALNCLLNENGISTTYGRINDKENVEIFQTLKNGFVDRNSESLCELLSKTDSLSKERILTNVKIKVLDEQIMLWKKYGFTSIESNPFMKEFSVKDMEFIIAKFDFNLYENYDDFKRQYTSFCELIKAGCGKDSNHNEVLRAYFEQRFGSETGFYELLNDETKLRSVYEKGAIGFTDILEKVDKEKAEQVIDESQQDSATQGIEENSKITQDVPLETPKNLSEEKTEVEQPEQSQNEEQQEREQPEQTPDEEQQEREQSEEIPDEDRLETQENNNNEVLKETITPKHMQSNWHMRSIEEMETTANISHKEDRNYQNNREVNEDNWMSRFKNWYKQSDRVPINERYSISEAMVKAVKEMNDPRITQEAQYEH